MSLGRRCGFFSLVIITSWLMTACGGDPPNKELQQAQQAIDEARAAGADRYAKDEFTASQDALKRAQADVVARDYRQALNDALDSRDRAQTASKNAVDSKAEARSKADQLLHDAALAIVDARAKLRVADTNRRAPRLVANLRREVGDAEMHVQKARTSLDAGDYLEALDQLVTPMLQLNDRVRALESTAPPAARRRR